MSEKDNLQEADGKEAIEATEIKKDSPKEETNPEAELLESEREDTKEESKEDDEAIDEIEASNAKKAEAETKHDDVVVEEKNYASMPMEELVSEFETLVKGEKIQVLKKHVEKLKAEFDKKFSALLEEKKKEFLDAGGNSIDFQFNFPLKSEFNAIYKTYREKRQQYYKNLETTLKTNLENRLEIIDEIKNLLNVEENINTTYKHFKALQERWRNAGPIPRDKYNNVWNNYHHHVENFYDFLHLNRDLRDLDFKHNLEQKQKIIARAEELAQDSDSNRAFRELQALHKMWKEELGPVAKEYREDIWMRFKAATKAIHDKRQLYFQELDKAYLKNLEKKQEIISEIEKLAEDDSTNHSVWQKKIKSVEDLRQQFFNAGKVPIKVNEATWSKFKEAVRGFNRKKNSFYKGLKKDQYNNLQKKLDLIKIAEEHKDSDDFEATTPLMKKVQSDWKQIGHVPRKDSDKIWNQFKSACNHYFNRLHEQKNASNKEEEEAYAKKNEVLAKLKSIKFTKDVQKNLKTIRSEVEHWRTLGKVPYNKRYIDGKFNKAINALYGKLDVEKSEVELLKFDNKIESFANSNDKRLLDNEHNFVRKRIDEIKGEINQLENNLQFFQNVDDDNPLVKEVRDKIDRHKTEFQTWKEKLKRIKQFY
ncbi:MAG: DUF349 domain-containing protein [Bacteroidia bacterium]|nr:DUF349 domain-containing protein [Bacteroidia bacterium]NND26150.1 DUF349 domain-containing protein [Flavobacteriaceae bacterium]NNL33402.1 DUF349 domain-containing protein [Flavobacteriaceae bacterium]